MKFQNLLKPVKKFKKLTEHKKHILNALNKPKIE